MRHILSTLFLAAVYQLLPAGFTASPVYAALSFQETIIDAGTLSDPWGKGYGDLDNDGDPDLIVGSMGSGLVWYKNPTWQKYSIASGSFSTDVETADFDQDGDLDVIAVTDSNIRLYKNNGTATSWSPQTVANRTMHDLEIADFNQDGKLDFVTRNQGGDGDFGFVYLQGTNLAFTEQSRQDLPIGEGLLVADLDNDGDSDIIWNEQWLENPGGNSPFSAWVKHTYASNYNSDTFIDVCDVNRDGKKDIILSPSEFQGGTGFIAYYRSPADPKSTGWTEVIVAANVETVHHFVGCADFDRDGDMDIASAEMQQGSDPDEVKIYENSGNHTTFTKVVLSTGGSHSMSLVDIDNDGDMDMFGANWSGQQAVKLWRNQSTPPKLSLTNWTYIQADSSRTLQKFGLGAGDLTGDGYSDIVSGQYFYRNPGNLMTGTWPRITLPSSSLDALLTVDVDSDSLGDVIAMNAEGQVYWLEAANTQGSSWTQTLVGSVGAADEGISSQGYLTAQLINGGKPEIILNVPGRLSYFSIPSNPGAGNWPNTVITTTITSEPEGVAAGDIDKDGDLDLATVINQTQVVWWRNPQVGGGSWSQFNLGTLPSEFGDRFGLADFDGDGDLDLAATVANGSLNGVYWFRCPSVPTNSWTRTTLLSGSTNPSVDTMNSMDVADLDSDGDPDIIASEHRGNQRQFILENSGTATFTVHTISSGIENHLGSRVFDLDADGDLDIIGIAWDSYQDLHVWRNNAISGTPQPTVTPGGPTPTHTPTPSITPAPTSGPSPTPGPIQIGETNLLGTEDCCNSNLLVAMKTTLSNQSFLQSLSFHVLAVGGRLRLGLYSDNNGQPQTLLAQTAEFTPVIGWNTHPVINSPLLNPGNYWLAYMPESDNLHFDMEPSGSGAWSSVSYGTLPATFPALTGSGAYHWSFYATLAPDVGPPPTDFDGDGDVDYIDFWLFLPNFNLTTGLGPFDLIPDSLINIFDFNRLLTWF